MNSKRSFSDNSFFTLRFSNGFAFLFFLLITGSCANERVKDQPKDASNISLGIQKDTLQEERVGIATKEEVNYRFEYKKIWSKKDSFEGFRYQKILSAINRVDVKHLQRLDSFLVPDYYSDSLAIYFPFPLNATCLKEIPKLLIFSYPTQSFAAYENGKLVLAGPTNMGKKSTPTPTGLFFCNWKSKETRSTVDDSWILKWNFNVSNMGGVGFHQYDLPGYPASHSCMRLWAEQAEFLYYWADQWKLSNQQLMAKGTPVIIYGAYPFGKPRPWFVLAKNPHELDLNEDKLEQIIAPYKAEIMSEQQKRAEYLQSTKHGLLANPEAQTI